MGYEEALRGIVAGARRTSPNWPGFMADVVYGSLEERIADVFRATGTVPTRSQYDRALAGLAQAPAAPEPEPEKPKKAKADKAAEEAPTEPAVEEEGDK